MNITNFPPASNQVPSPISNKIKETSNNNIKELKSLVQFFNGQAWISNRKKLNHLVQKFSDLSEHLQAGVNKEDVDLIRAEIGRMKDSCALLKENRQASVHLKKINRGIRSLEEALPLKERVKERAAPHPKKTESVGTVAKKTGVIEEKKVKAPKKGKETVKTSQKKSKEAGEIESVKEVKGDPNYLPKLALKCAFAGLLIGGGVLYYMRYFSPPDASETQTLAQNTTGIPPQMELPMNICTIPEYAELCKGNLGIARVDMPQILGDVQKYFLGNYSSQGIEVLHTTMPATGLTPIQGEMNTQKIFSMMEAHRAHRFNVCEEPILVTGGDIDPTTGDPIYFVADGHHRFAACNLLDLPMEVVVIKELATKVLTDALNFPGVFRAGL